MPHIALFSRLDKKVRCDLLTLPGKESASAPLQAVASIDQNALAALRTHVADLFGSPDIGAWLDATDGMQPLAIAVPDDTMMTLSIFGQMLRHLRDKRVESVISFIMKMERFERTLYHQRLTSTDESLRERSRRALITLASDAA
jgi:hypothetical protein